jgi:hypothetical protein
MSLEDHILKETGVEPVDCGTHPLFNANAEELHRSLACARDAIKQHLAFKTFQRGLGVDTEVAYGLIGLRDGAVMWFEYQQRPCGSSTGCNERFQARRAYLEDVLVIHDAQGFHRFWWTDKR